MTTRPEEPAVKKHHSAAPIAMEVVGGAAAGAALGALAGPPGMAIGAAIGGLVGAAAGIALRDTDIQDERHDTQLDVDIGVFGGDLGEVQPHPASASLGAFHTASLGLGVGSSGTPSEGPMQNLDG